MKQLENSIFQLKNNQNWALKVESVSPSGNYQTIENNVKKATLEQKYSSVENFFEELNKRGLTKLRITDRIANGSVFKTLQAYEVEFQNGNATEMQPAQPAATAYNPTIGMNGTGLGMVEIHRIHDYDRVMKENIKLETKVEMLTAANEKLKEINLTNELLGTKKVESTEAQAKLMASASAYIPLVQAFLMGNRGQAAAPGLGNPVSPVKEIFVKMDDEFLSDLLPIVQGMQNVEFENELSLLLKKYNLISV